MLPSRSGRKQPKGQNYGRSVRGQRGASPMVAGKQSRKGRKGGR